jgi:hypothetical protein
MMANIYNAEDNSSLLNLTISPTKTDCWDKVWSKLRSTRIEIQNKSENVK